MKIGILTLPLQINYGGILQAYALQTILQRMGHKTQILDRPRKRRLPLLRMPCVYAKRIFLKYIKGEGNQISIFHEQYYNKTYSVISQNIRPFIDNHINYYTVYDFNTLRKLDLDAIIVGSDQVWRPPYFGKKEIKQAYLYFAKEWHIKRVAYAASFGTSQWEYSSRQTKVCSKLVQKFDAVSVREESAIKLCQKHLNVNAKQVLDPTMLLTKEDYIQVVEKSDTLKSNGTLLTYILDPSKEKELIIEQVANKGCMLPFSANSTKTENLYAPINERIQPSIEQWLRGFMDAEFIVTDSFHGAVFSILFQKPFIVIGNKRRGLARMESLLSMFGLEDRLITNINRLEETYHQKIDYRHSNSLLDKYRKKSMLFLHSNLI